MRHTERHRTHRIGWLRAAVLGADDGIVSTADTECADLARESKELAASPEPEHAELTAVYVKRGLDAELASNVATQLMRHDALGAHARDELGISDTLAARPGQAAFASAGTLAVGSR